MARLSGRASRGMTMDEYVKQETSDIPRVRWIPATERMPEDFVSVLVHIPSEAPLPTVHEAYWAGEVWMTRDGGFLDSEITHWRDMPEPPKDGCKMTNGDKIRAMSDEELSEFINNVSTCDCCVHDGDCKNWDDWDNPQICMDGVKKWLQQPAEGIVND